MTDDDLDVFFELDETLGEELRDTFQHLMHKMVAGKREHSDQSLELPLDRLIAETDAELLDFIGWSVIGRRRLNVLKGMAQILEQRISEMHQKAHPIYEIPAGTSVPAALRNQQSGSIHYYEPGPTWQPIETAPKDGTVVLVCHNGVRSLSHWIADTNDTSKGTWLGFWQHEPTHWHPLPDPPDASFYQGPKK